MTDARDAMATLVTHDEVSDRDGKKRSLVVVAGGAAIIGAITGVVVALPLAAAGGLQVFIATALDVAAGLALLGGLIGANIAGTD